MLYPGAADPSIIIDEFNKVDFFKSAEISDHCYNPDGSIHSITFTTDSGRTFIQNKDTCLVMSSHFENILTT
jgi:hypothetical protein